MSPIHLDPPVAKDEQLAHKGVDPMLAMMERLASNKDVDVEKLQRLIDMQKDILRENAKSAFNASFHKLQADLPTIEERGKTDKGTYATLEDIVETVRPILSRHGFSLSHRAEWPDKTTVRVVGILTHEQGHSRESEFLSSADQSGSKNAIQALGSAVAYGRRYTTKDLLNIVTREEDDDGNKAGLTDRNAPEGFDAWLDAMDDFVLQGCTRKQLDEKWYASPEPFRKHISRTNVKRVEEWKKKATK